MNEQSRATERKPSVEWWRDNAASRASATLDWNAIAEAMTAVRAP